MSRCEKCHRWVTSAPSPEVDHKGGNHGVNCQLPHRPHPCDFLDKNGGNCQAIPAPENVLVDVSTDGGVSQDEESVQRQAALSQLGLGDDARK